MSYRSMQFARNSPMIARCEKCEGFLDFGQVAKDVELDTELERQCSICGHTTRLWLEPADEYIEFCVVSDPPQQRVQHGTFVYMIWDGEHYKIGMARDPEARRRQLQTGNPKQLHVLVKWPGGAHQEQSIHAILEAHRITGEWFELDRNLSWGVYDAPAVYEDRDS